MGRAVLALAVVAISVACGVGNRARFGVARGPGEPLIPPLRSFMGAAVAQAALGQPAQWRVYSDLKRKGAWAAPAYRDTWVEVADYRFANHPGTLWLHFCNDRLHDARFYPLDQQAVMVTVERQLKATFFRRKGWKHSLARASTNVVVVAGEDGLCTHQYVSWSDDRLLHESDSWWTLFARGEQGWEGSRRTRR